MENELKQSLYRAEIDGFFSGVKAQFETIRGTITTPFNYKAYDKEIRVEYVDRLDKDRDPIFEVMVIPTHLKDVPMNHKDLASEISYYLEMLYNNTIN